VHLTKDRIGVFLQFSFEILSIAVNPPSNSCSLTLSLQFSFEILAIIATIDPFHYEDPSILL
jgi:hypothetical protein